MELLKEIIRDPGMATAGKTIFREAVRGIILDERKLLMIHLPRNGTYKFPGGGIAGEETPEEALAREILEECGARVSKILRPFGKVIEFSIPKEEDFDVFRMTSSYYLCEVESAFAEQHLDAYEHDLGFYPVWVDVDEAIHSNLDVLLSRREASHRWNARETFVLEQIKVRLFAD